MQPDANRLRLPVGLHPVEVAKPWFALRDQRQAIFDNALPTSVVARRAEQMLDYIDTQLGRLSGIPRF